MFKNKKTKERSITLVEQLYHNVNRKAVETIEKPYTEFFINNNNELDSREWMKRSFATWKTGVKFHNFGALNQEQVSSYAPDLSAEFLYTDWSQDKIKIGRAHV